jgi:hypothetical protein
MLPAWIGEQRSVPEAGVNFSADTKPTWKFVSHRISAQPDPIYPYDPAVLEAIQGFWPDAVYLRHLWIYERDGKQHLFMRHAVGSKLRNPKFAPPEQPTDGNFDAPVQVEITLCAESDEDVPDLPGEFVDWSWGTYHYVRACYRPGRNAYDAFLEKAQASDARRERAIEKAFAEEEYIRKQDAKLIQRCLDQITDGEIKEMQARYAEEDRQAWLNRQCQIRKEQESKPLYFYLSKGD